MIIEARLVDDVTECPAVHLATIERELTTDTLGLSLAEGKAILSSAQPVLRARTVPGHCLVAFVL
jgi:hypothetical protein